MYLFIASEWRFFECLRTQTQHRRSNVIGQIDSNQPITFHVLFSTCVSLSCPERVFTKLRQQHQYKKDVPQLLYYFTSVNSHRIR